MASGGVFQGSSVGVQSGTKGLLEGKKVCFEGEKGQNRLFLASGGVFSGLWRVKIGYFEEIEGKVGTKIGVV